jgi:hypothetical protein
MAITLNATISTDIRMVLAGEMLADFREARKADAKIPEGYKVTKREQFMLDLMASDKTDEECLKVIVVDALKRDLADLIREELPKGSRVAPVKVDFKVSKAPRNCQGCIETNCVRAERNTNSGCASKRTGIRAPVNSPIPTSFGERIVSGWDAGCV